MSALRNHLCGLLKLVELKGGLDKLGMDGLLSKLIQLWVPYLIYVIATLADLRRYLWFLDVFSPLSITWSRCNTQISSSEFPTFYQLFTFYHLDDSFPCSDQSLTSILHEIYRSLNNEDSNVYYHSEERSTGPPDESRTTCLVTGVSISYHIDQVRESCRLAYLIWTLRDRCSTNNKSSMLQALKESLDKTNLSDYWLPIPGALLWCLLIGVNMTHDTHTLYPWFTSQLLSFWVPISLHRWQGFQRSLDCFGRLFKCGQVNKGVVNAHELI